MVREADASIAKLRQEMDLQMRRAAGERKVEDTAMIMAKEAAVSRVSGGSNVYKQCATT